MIIGFILAFWLFLPLPMMFLGMGNFNTLDYSALEQVSEPNFFTYVSTSVAMLSIYFKILFLGIPEAPLIINVFIGFLKLMSGIVIALLLKGE